MNSRALCVLFDRLGPYHHARLAALGRHTTLVAIEMTDTDSIYAWDKIDGAMGFRKITLVHGRETRTLPASILIRRLCSVLDDLRPRAVAIPGWSERWAVAALGWCASNSIAAILMSDSHSIGAVRAPHKELVKARLLNLFSSALVAGAPQVEYLTHLGMAKQFIFTGYDVVDNEYFRDGADLARANAVRFRVQEGLPERFFLSCSRFVAEKNLPNLCRAYAHYRQRVGFAAWKLVLVGDGPMSEVLNSLAVDLGMEDDLRIVTFKQYAALPIYYGLASAFLLVSTQEPWGLVVNEAMAAGLPIIVSRRCGCARDLVKEGINGLVVDPDDADAIGEAMVRISSQQSNVVDMANASRRIIEQWSPELFARNMLLAEETAVGFDRGPTSLVDRALVAALSYRA